MKILVTLIFIITLTYSAFGQEIVAETVQAVPYTPIAKPADTFKISASFVNAEYYLNPLVATKNLYGFSIDADGRVFDKAGFRLGGVVNFERVGINQNTTPIATDPIDTYTFGPQLSYHVGPVEPFVGALFGIKTTYNNDNQYVRKYRLGVDVPFSSQSHVFVRPFFVEWERQGGFLSPATHRYGAGVGFRF